jgi:hypothetical protein
MQEVSVDAAVVSPARQAVHLSLPNLNPITHPVHLVGVVPSQATQA